ncbi:MAG: 2Fe-2S iron-sulfur cluster binding domain-containing protein [Flavobacteriaceae bacterium]|nr:2Fe-2S iron-sulfur cluster binding domain-containing protein [Flavobacteriaceae bacterium]
MEDTLIAITILDRKGHSHTHKAPINMGLNLMELLKMAELPILGECGGMAMCATCQVYVLSSHPLPKASEEELAMLDQAFFVNENSRLACQIHLSKDLNGLLVQMAPENAC